MGRPFPVTLVLECRATSGPERIDLGSCTPAFHRTARQCWQACPIPSQRVAADFGGILPRAFDCVGLRWLCLEAQPSTSSRVARLWFVCVVTLRVVGSATPFGRGRPFLQGRVWRTPHIRAASGCPVPHAWHHRWSSGIVCFLGWGCVAAALFAAPFSGGSALLFASLVAVGSAFWWFTSGVASKNEQAVPKLMASVTAVSNMIFRGKFTVSPFRNRS